MDLDKQLESEIGEAWLLDVEDMDPQSEQQFLE